MIFNLIFEEPPQLWRQTIIPLVNKTARGLSHWLGPYLGDELTLHPDLGAVPALSEERAALWSRLSAARFLTDEERRQMAGLAHEGAQEGAHGETRGEAHD